MRRLFIFSFVSFLKILQLAYLIMSNIGFLSSIILVWGCKEVAGLPKRWQEVNLCHALIFLLIQLQIYWPLASTAFYGNPPENPTTPITLAFSKIKNRQVNTYPAPKSLKHKSFKLKNNFIVKGCTVYFFLPSSFKSTHSTPKQNLCKYNKMPINYSQPVPNSPSPECLYY